MCVSTTGCPGPSTAIISFYLIVLGFLLFAFEARVGVMYEAFFRKFFGFMYGYWGRFLFILFLASMVVAVINDQANLWFIVPVVAAFTIANALLNCFIIRRHPGFQSGEAQVLSEQDRANALSQIPNSTPIARSDFGVDSGATARPTYTSAPYSSKPTSGGGDNPFAAVVV